SGAVDYDFGPFDGGDLDSNFLQAWERIVICGVDPAVFRASYGLPASIRVLGPWTGALGNQGERINIRDKNDTIRCTLRYDDRHPWPVKADGG
ncbi:MAG: hypothetical protein GWO24_10255, partial [Akkermansiaceae bacterium]|nr:hypothetical protein [Akkermansiaceae bacterium]